MEMIIISRRSDSLCSSYEIFMVSRVALFYFALLSMVHLGTSPILYLFFCKTS